MTGGRDGWDQAFDRLTRRWVWGLQHTADLDAFRLALRNVSDRAFRRGESWRQWLVALVLRTAYASESLSELRGATASTTDGRPVSDLTPATPELRVRVAPANGPCVSPTSILAGAAG
jgi:hypothetical protein